MQLKQLPADHTGVYEGIKYLFEDTADNENYEFSIRSGEKVIGEKKIIGNGGNYNVDVTNYILKEFSFSPLESEDLLVEAGGRVLPVSLSCAGVIETPVSYILPGCRSADGLSVLTDAPIQDNISYNGTDEISFIAVGKRIRAEVTADGNNVLETAEIECGSDVCCLLFNTSRYIDNFRLSGTVSIALYADDILFYEKSYNILPYNSNTVRFYWQNPYGCFDSYTFYGTGTETIHNNKKRINGPDGYDTVSSETWRYRNYSSRNENIATLRWLSGIISSRNVYIQCADGLRRTDIITESVEMGYSGSTVINFTIKENIFNNYPQ